MWSFEGNTGSLWGRVVAVSAPGSDVWASSCVGCDLPGSYQCGEICSGDIPIPCCCCRALGRYLLYTQRKRLLVSLFTLYWLITLWMWLPPFSSLAFILASSCLKQAWQDLPPLFWGVCGFFLAFLHHPCTQSFAAPAFLQNMFCLWLPWVTVFIIKSAINCNRASLAKCFHDGFPKQVWIGSAQGYEISAWSLQMSLWVYEIANLKLPVTADLSLPLSVQFSLAVALPSCWGTWGICTCVSSCTGRAGAALIFVQTCPVLLERCPLWLWALSLFVGFCFVPLLPARWMDWTRASSARAKSGYWVGVMFSTF